MGQIREYKEPQSAFRPDAKKIKLDGGRTQPSNGCATCEFLTLAVFIYFKFNVSYFRTKIGFNFSLPL